MSTIDWSKAPEGATHCYPTSPQPWRDLSGRNWKYFMCGQWHPGPSVSLSSEFKARALGETLFERPGTSAALRNKACDEMFGVILTLPEDRRHNRSDICEALYDAGYRKFEIGDGEA